MFDFSDLLWFGFWKNILEIKNVFYCFFASKTTKLIANKNLFISNQYHKKDFDGDVFKDSTCLSV